MFDMSNVEILSEMVMLSSNNECYYKDLLNADGLYEMGINGQGLVCAVIDSGCDPNHPLLKDKIIGGRNFTSEGSVDNFDDLNGHGTHVAGLIAADPCGPFKGGMAPGAKLIICKALNKNGSGDFNDIIEAIEYAIEQNVNVINMSLGSRCNLPRLYNVVKKAYDKGIVICCASGNEARGDNGTVDEHCYPGYYREVIEVGSIDKFKKPSYFSNSNNLIDCVCYGEQILSTFKKQSYAVLDGTSQATPLVAGCILLLQQWFLEEFGRQPSKDEVYAVLIKCSSLISGYSRKQVGFGCIDINKLFD